MNIPVGDDKSGLVTLLKCTEHNKVFGDVEPGCPVCIEEDEEKLALTYEQEEHYTDLGPARQPAVGRLVKCQRHRYIFLSHESCPACDAELDSIINNRSFNL